MGHSFVIITGTTAEIKDPGEIYTESSWKLTWQTGKNLLQRRERG
jgi:hypothetical protein